MVELAEPGLASSAMKRKRASCGRRRDDSTRTDVVLMSPAHSPSNSVRTMPCTTSAPISSKHTATAPTYSGAAIRCIAIRA